MNNHVSPQLLTANRKGDHSSSMVIIRTPDFCGCGKPIAHTRAPEDSREWACRVPEFDPHTGIRVPVKLYLDE